jgi:hypothetical protein
MKYKVGVINFKNLGRKEVLREVRVRQ